MNTNSFSVFRLTIASIVISLSSSMASVPTIDGLIGSEWTGIVPEHVAYNASAALGNFGAPGPDNHLVGYNVYIRADSSYVYGAFETTPLGLGLDGHDASLAQNFVNLYIDTNPSTGSDLGFEITNNRAFIPGGVGYYPNLTSTGVDYASVLGTSYANGGDESVIEIAIPWSYFETDPQGIGFPTGDHVQFRLVQAFGYSVAGGAANFGADRLGEVTKPAPVPEPGLMPLMAVGLCSLAALRRRR